MNRKKHTIFKKRASILSILIPIFLISGCVNTPTTPVNIPTPPKITESVIPTLKKVSDGIDKTIESNRKIDDKIKEQKAIVLEQKISIVETIAKVERLQEKVISDQLIKEIEVLDIVNELKEIETRNLFLEKQNSELEVIRKDQEAILKMTKEDASITYKKLIDKENEASELRNQNTFLSKNLQIKNNEVISAQKEKEKLIKEKADAMVYKKLFWYVIGIYILLLIVKNVWMSVNPTARLRW